MTKQELYLYRLTAELAIGKTIDVVVIATSDESAFDYAMQELERAWLPTPVVHEWFIEEKKRMRRGVGYALGIERD